jgi:hypothetical protein
MVHKARQSMSRHHPLSIIVYASYRNNHGRSTHQADGPCAEVDKFGEQLESPSPVRLAQQHLHAAGRLCCTTLLLQPLGLKLAATKHLTNLSERSLAICLWHKKMGWKFRETFLPIFTTRVHFCVWS